MPITLRAISIALILSGVISTPVLAATPPASSTDMLLSGAQKWVASDRDDLARKLLQKVLLIEPASPPALLMLGKIELKEGKPEAAKRYLKTLQQTAPDSASTRELNDALTSTGSNQPSFKNSQVQTGKTVGFEQPVVSGKPVVAEKATVVEKAFDSPKTKVVLPEESKTVAVAKSKVETKHHKSVTKSKKIETDQPTIEKPAEQPAVTETAAAAIDPDIIARTDALDALEDGKADVAEAGLLDVFKRRPQDREVIGGLGMVKQAQGKYDEAEKWFEQALQAAKAEKADTTRWESLVVMAQFSQKISAAKVLLEEKKLSEAEAAASEALVLKPGYPDALYVMGNIKEAQNDLVEAERLYREALKTEGYNVFAAKGLAGLLGRTKRSPEAIEFIESVLRDYPREWKKSPYSQASLMRVEAEMLIEAHQSSRAMNTLEQAIKVDPKNAWVRLSLARLYVSLDLVPMAKQIMEEGIALDPKNPTMHFTQALLLLGMNENAAGLATLNQIPENELTQDMRDIRNVALIKYDFQQAEKMIAQGNRKEAMRIMSIAEVQAAGNYPATEQVAEGWFKLGLQKQGLSAISKLPKPVPLSTQIRFAYLLNSAEMDKELTDFLPTVQIPEGTDDTTTQYRATIRDIEFSMAGRQADSLMKAGDKEQAQQLAESTLSAYHVNISDYFKFHRRYFASVKLHAGAISQLIEEKAHHPDDLNIRWELAYAYFQENQNSNAQKEVQDLLVLTKADDIDMRLRIADLQQGTGDKAGSQHTIDDLLSAYPDNTLVLLHAGNIAKSAGQYNRAMKFYQRIKLQNTTSDTAPSPQVEKAAQPGVLLDLLPEKTAAGAAKVLPVDADAANVIAPELVSTPESDKVLQNALAGDNVKAQPVMNFTGSEADQAMESIKARQSSTIGVGLDLQNKPASKGTSTYNAIEIPVLARFPIGYEAQGFVQVDQVKIDSGALPSRFADAALFGQIQTAKTVPSQPLTSSVSGTSLSAGYEQGSVKVDIGKVGMGFPVSNTVGGIRQNGMMGSLSYSLNLSRRPVTGSQLSYAGEIDPVSHQIWGGVTNTGVSLYMSTHLSSAVTGDLNASVMGSYGSLHGTNVLSNDKVSLTGIINKDIYTANDKVVNLGLSLSYFSFSKNLSYFTYGQGGYYSPQGSMTLAIPLELNGRANKFTYQLKTSVSYADTHTNASSFFPNDAALQAVAVSGTMPEGYTQPVYSAGKSSGFGYSVLAATEYRATPSVALGGRFSIDRSAYYSPNSAFFYLRYLFNPETGALKLRPDPVIPYSQY